MCDGGGRGAGHKLGPIVVRAPVGHGHVRAGHNTFQEWIPVLALLLLVSNYNKQVFLNTYM